MAARVERHPLSYTNVYVALKPEKSEEVSNAIIAMLMTAWTSATSSATTIVRPEGKKKRTMDMTDSMQEKEEVSQLAIWKIAS